MPFSFRQWFFFILFSIIIFITSTIHTLHSGFFSVNAESRNASTVESSVVFTMFDISAVIFSPIVGTFLPVFGVKRVICISIFIQAFLVTLFGALEDVSTHWLFITYALLLRFFEGMAFIWTTVGIYCMIPSEFSNAVALIYGVLTMWFIIGNASGPFIGNLLYGMGGFLCPFLTVGVVLVTISLFMPLLFWKSPFYPVTGETARFFSLFRKPMTLLNFLVLGIVMMLMIFFYTSLPTFLTKTFHLQQTEVGWTFGMVVFAQALTCPLWGSISRDLLSTQFIILIGGLMSVGGSILIGPLPVLGIPANLLSTYCGLVLLSIGVSAVFLASFLCATKEALRYGFLDNSATSGMVAAGYLGMIFLGSAIGSVLPALFDESTMGFKDIPYATFSLSLIIFCLDMLYAGGSVFRKLCGKKDVLSLLTVEDPLRETTPLLKQSTSTPTPFDDEEENPYILQL